MDNNKNKKNLEARRLEVEVAALREEIAKLRDDLNWYQVEAVARTNTRWST